MRVLELPDMLRKYGVEPVLVAGWQTRGNEFPARPQGALRHWTAGPTTGRTPSLGVVTNGRSDLPGPLCAVLQSREPTGRDKAYVVASGKANHAGNGTWNGISGNYKLLGLEIEWAGPREAFSAARKDVSERIMAALLDCTTGTDSNVAEHREYATPAGRKVDTNLSGDELRRRMSELRHSLPPSPLPAPTPQPEDDEMAAALFFFKGPDGQGTHAYHVVGNVGKWMPSAASISTIEFLGVKRANQPDKPFDKVMSDTVALLDGPCKNVT